MTGIIKAIAGKPTGEMSFLPSFSMRKLGDIVAIVGQNGIGKSKFLEFIANEVWSKRPASKIEYYDEHMSTPSVAFIPDDLVLWNDAQNTQDSFFAAHINRILPTVLSILKESAQEYALSCIPETTMTTIEKNNARDRWSTLRENVAVILQRDLAISRGGKLLLSGIEISEDNLSRGQSRLLQIAVALSTISDNQPIVIIWDEPELHLHPKIIQKVFDVILKKFRCQIWLATHSLPLVSHIGIDSVWLMSGDSLERGIRKKDKLIEDLFGGEEQVDQLEMFLSPIDDLACVSFARDCLGRPDVLGYEDNDPQGKQVFDVLKNRVSRISRPVRILDWGAGKGRLVDAARYEFFGQGNLNDVLDYVGYDISDENRQECVRAISKVWADAERRWICELSKIRQRFSHEKADIVTLVNVLHEIPPVEWVKVLNEIGEAIDSGGNLLIVEDLALPRGEMPNKSGFLLLDEASMRSLFSDRDKELIFDYRLNERLMMTIVPGNKFPVNIDGLSNCLDKCANGALAEIEDVRSSGKNDFFSGIKHMRAAMQFVNATLSKRQIPR